MFYNDNLCDALQARPRREVPTGPAVTVFVGNITERAPDAMVRHLLTTCGPVISWKRVQGATGKLQAFGFCEYNNPDAGLRAIRLLNEFTIADKKLVVKVHKKFSIKMLSIICVLCRLMGKRRRC